MFFYDFPNLLAIFIVIIICFRNGLIPLWLSFFLGLFALTPFFLNDFLFPASYMPDQFQYFHEVRQIRSFDFEPVRNMRLTVSNWIFALTPLPYVETIKSLGFFNRLIATVLTIWLYSKKNLRGWPLLFILFYPSFLLYSSLSLRDTIVFMFMIVSVILFIENRRLLAILISLPLLIIKGQNFFLLIVFFVIHLYFSKGSLFYRYRYFLIILVIGAITPFLMTIIELLDYFRLAFFVEDGGLSKDYVNIKSFRDFAVIALQSGPYFMMKPFPWEADSLLQLIQSVENIFIFCFLTFIFYKTSQIDKNITFKWLVYLFAALSIYGLVVFNFGTAVRYKFPFILITILGACYEIYYKHGKLIFNRAAKRLKSGA